MVRTRGSNTGGRNRAMGRGEGESGADETLLRPMERLLWLLWLLWHSDETLDLRWIPSGLTLS